MIEYGDEVVTDSLPLAEVKRNGLCVVLSSSDDGPRLDLLRRGRALLRMNLGVTVSGRDLRDGSRFLRASRRTIPGVMHLRSGKTTAERMYEHEEVSMTFQDADDREWCIDVRVADDGFAVQYSIPDLQGTGTLDAEATSLSLESFERGWLLDYQTWYETPRFGQDVADIDTGAYGFPVLFRSEAGDHLLVSEAGIDGRYSGSHANIDGATRTLSFSQADASTEVARGAITPWRVFIIGEVTDVVESTFVDELAPEQNASIEDASWVRPGRAAWSWWSDFYSGAQLEQQKHFVDVAAQLGWEHLLIDCGWEETWVPEIVSYASQFGIQVHLWTVWHDLDGPEKLGRLALWRSWGVAGIKVDFMESESKDRYRWYDTILQETARLELMVNFHGSVIPRGWARTWPQVVGYEAIRGSEYYVFYNDTPLSAAHNVIQPFTRNVVGGMDYTPVAFTAPGRTTSDGHELALSVAFECGITHFADGVDAYLERPEAARFMAQLAPSWDETILLGGTPDTEAVIARRSGERWFLGVIATGPARVISVPLDRLGTGPFNVWTVGDRQDDSNRGLTESRGTVTSSLAVPVARDGGFVAIVAPPGAELFRSAGVEPTATPAVDASIVELGPDGRVVITVPDACVVRVAPRWTTTALGNGRWEVRAPKDLTPGGLGVVTLEAEGVRGVAAVSHIRVIRPLEGTVAVSSLPMLAFRNESGPVERNMSNGGGNPRDGKRMRVGGSEFGAGLGMSSPAEARFYLGQRALRLVGAVGIDDETPGTDATVFVEADGETLLRLDLSAGKAPVEFDLDVAGRNFMTLRSRPRSGQVAHIDWIEPTLFTSNPKHQQQPGH